MEDTELMVNPNWKVKVLLIGGAFGALVGVTAAYLFANQTEKSGRAPKLSSSEGIRIALLILGLIRQVASIPEND